MKVSKDCIDLIHTFEGLKLEPYLDSAKIPTIGFGSIYHLDGITRVTMEDDPIDLETAEKLLLVHLNTLAKTVEYLVQIDLGQSQIDALLSLVYNIGTGNFKHSTLLKLLNTGDTDKAAEQILVWNRTGGKISAGLTRRREAEHDLFLS